MNYLDNPVGTLSSCMAHAMYRGFPDIEYEDRDWEKYKTDPNARVKKKKQHTEYDMKVFAMFPQTWSSTALGFGGIGGQSITDAYTVVIKSTSGYGYCVYFGGQFAYRIDRPNDKFYIDIEKMRMAAVKDHHGYEWV